MSHEKPHALSVCGLVDLSLLFMEAFLCGSLWGVWCQLGGVDPRALRVGWAAMVGRYRAGLKR